MANHDDMIELIKSISGQANILTIPRVYIGFAKSHRTALFLSQCVYWSDRASSNDGWFYKSFSEWRRELGLNQHAVETCVKALVAGGWLITKIEKHGTRLTTYYRVDLEKIAESIKSTLADSAIVETAKVHKRKTIMSSIKQKLPAKTTNTDAEKAPRPRDPLFDAIAQVTATDPATAGASIGKVKSMLLKANPPYTADEVLRFGEIWPSWKDTPPSLWQLQEQIGRVRQNGNAKGQTPHGNDQEYSEPRYTPEQIAAAEEINRRRAERRAAQNG